MVFWPQKLLEMGIVCPQRGENSFFGHFPARRKAGKLSRSPHFGCRGQNAPVLQLNSQDKQPKPNSKASFYASE